MGFMADKRSKRDLAKWKVDNMEISRKRKDQRSKSKRGLKFEIKHKGQWAAGKAPGLVTGGEDRYSGEFEASGLSQAGAIFTSFSPCLDLDCCVLQETFGARCTGQKQLLYCSLASPHSEDQCHRMFLTPR